MKILNAAAIRDWDQYTISHEPISSIDLMERAAIQCADWLDQHGYSTRNFSIFCGKGNNGGDGLALARLLARQGNAVTVNILEFGHKGTEDFQTNLARLHELPAVQIRFLQSDQQFPELNASDIIIDALFGSGLNRGLDGVTAALVNFLNNSPCEIIAIDVPSGLFVDHSSAGNCIIRASHTLSFQCLKPAFLVAENSQFTGQVQILNIGLLPAYLDSVTDATEWIEPAMIASIYHPRNQFAHKGNFGHALLIAGSHGKMGAAILAALACLRSGSGLLSCHVPSIGYSILQTAVPEAMVIDDPSTDHVSKMDYDPDRFNSIGIGPGIDTETGPANVIKQLIDRYHKPMLIDADALNILAAHKEWLNQLPAGSVLTPHPKEFSRLFGETKNDFERIDLAIQKAKELNVVIVLKGHHTLIANPQPGTIAYFNSTGNAGMAKGGTGDLLSGVITALLSQGYSPLNASVLGVYLHGLAADLAVTTRSQESLIATDIIEHLGEAFLEISQYQPARQSGQ